MSTTNITIRMDTTLKSQAEHLFDNLGMNMSTAFNVFVRQALREGGIPFRITTDVPNRETMKAMLEAEQLAGDEHSKGYRDMDELMAALKS